MAGRGKRIGPYELGATLRNGQGSKLKLATAIDDENAGNTPRRRVAVKVLDQGGAWRAQNELRARRAMGDHRHIVRLERVLRSTSCYFLVQPLAEASLHDRVAAGGKPGAAAARAWFHHLVLAVGHMHAHGIVHCNLGPRHCLLDEGELRVCGLGHAVAASDPIKNNQTVVYSAECAAPELRKRLSGGEAVVPCVDWEKVDAWGCGVVLFFMLVGELPNHKVPAVKFASGGVGPPIPPALQPACARRLLEGLLSHDPAERLSLGDVQRHEFVCAHEPTPSPTPTPTPSQQQQGDFACPLSPPSRARKTAPRVPSAVLASRP